LNADSLLSDVVRIYSGIGRVLSRRNWIYSLPSLFLPPRYQLYPRPSLPLRDAYTVVLPA
jgi:hypothetical protein